jgi:hypothetical protein
MFNKVDWEDVFCKIFLGAGSFFLLWLVALSLVYPYCYYASRKANIESVCYDQEFVLRQQCLNFPNQASCTTLNFTERRR